MMRSYGGRYLLKVQFTEPISNQKSGKLCCVAFSPRLCFEPVAQIIDSYALKASDGKSAKAYCMPGRVLCYDCQVSESEFEPVFGPFV